jgi:hypothetical protein
MGLLTVQLDKELKEKKQAIDKVLDANTALQEIKLLMNGDSQEDLRIANGLGKQHTIVKAQNEIGKKLELEKLDDSFDGAVYTIDQIKALAIRYNLRFLSSQLFTSTIEVQAIAKIKEFAKKTNTSIDDYLIQKKFFILAPEKCFELVEDKLPKTKYPDPALFYKIDETHYKLIHKWGVDFSVTRLLQGFKWSSAGNWFLHRLGISFPIAALILSLVTSGMFPIIYPLAYWSAVTGITLVYSCIAYRGVILDGDGDRIEKLFGPAKWNTNTFITKS